MGECLGPVQCAPDIFRAKADQAIQARFARDSRPILGTSNGIQATGSAMLSCSLSLPDIFNTLSRMMFVGI
jgi:hypothetical protein